MDLVDDIENFMTGPIYVSWRERVWDLLPTHAIRLPSERAQTTFWDAAFCYLVEQEVAALALARTAMELTVQEQIDDHQVTWTDKPSSPWARRPPRGRPRFPRKRHTYKDGYVESLQWGIEDLHAAQHLSDEEAHACHELRCLGNKAVHRSKASAEEARAELEHLRLVLSRVR